MGFLGVGQIEYDKKEDESRVDKLKTDLVMLGLFEAGGVLVKSLTKGTKNVISTFVKKAAKDIKGKGADIAVLEKEVQVVKEAIKKDTGQEVGVVLTNNMTKATDKEIQSVTKSVTKPQAPTGVGGVTEVTKPISKTIEQKAKPVVKPKEVNVPREQLPVTSEGKEKISRLEARVTKSLNKAPQEVKDQLGSTFNQMNKAEQKQKAIKYILEKPDEAMAVLKGEKEAPAGLLKNSIYVAMENMGKGDVELARKLASLRSTRAGQELSILTEIDPNSPVKAMRDIIVVREEAFKKRYAGKSVKEVSDKVVSDIKKKIKPIDKYSWSAFIKDLPTC